MVLRSVRTPNEGEFVPHLSLSIGILLAFVCVATLVFFVGHMAGRINVDTVIEFVQPGRPCDGSTADRRTTAACTASSRFLGQCRLDSRSPTRLSPATRRGRPRRLGGRAQHRDPPAGPTWRLCVSQRRDRDGQPDRGGRRRRHPQRHGPGPQRVSSADLEFAVRQLVEVAVRALSPGINDPHTAISVLDRLGAALCDIVPLHLPTGVSIGGGGPVLVVPSVDYGGLVDAMFHLIRQNAADSPAVLIRMQEVLSAVAGCERDPARVRRCGATPIWCWAMRHAILQRRPARRHPRAPCRLCCSASGRSGCNVEVTTGGRFSCSPLE